ncbi:MAG: four helix bundle protein [Flavobacteriales bacterium]|nr:four helix bundle protein [Flavobacteriales bacterium]
MKKERVEKIFTGKQSGFRSLVVYQKAFQLACEIHELSKSFPKEELFGTTSQIKRASKSVCANIGEAYRKRQYTAHFASKMSDANMENTEVQVWCDFSFASDYITEEQYSNFLAQSEEVGAS